MTTGGIVCPMTATTQRDSDPERDRASEFDTDTAVAALGDGRFTAQLSERWGVGPALNGGYGLAVALRATRATVGHADPLTATCHFLAALEEGPADMAVDVAKAGRNLSTAQAELRQAGRERLRVLATFGELAADPAPLLIDGAPPELPDPDACVGNEPGVSNPSGMPLGDRFLYRVEPGTGGRMAGQPSGEPVVRAWARFADGRDFDLLGLACLVDALPPAAMEIGVAGWAPTVELTVHLRAHPAPGWVAVALRTRFVQGGYFEEDAEVWDSAGRLAAQSRQLARMPA